MGRRRRRKVIHIMRKRLPKIFTCPNCGAVSVRVVEKENNINGNEIYEYKVVCGNCKKELSEKYEKKMEIIDIYNRFVDKVMKGEI